MSNVMIFDRPIKSIPLVLQRFGEMSCAKGKLFRAPNGIYMAKEGQEASSGFVGFSSNEQLISYINANLPWNAWRTT